MVVFDKKIVSNSEANYILIGDKVFSKKALSNYVHNSNKDYIIVDNKKIDVISKKNKSKIKYYLLLDGKEFCLDHSQSSYNLEKNFYKYATENNILIEDHELEHARKEKDGNAYVLNGYEFKLGEGVLSLIGEEYKNRENKFITSLNKSNGKFQIYRKVYEEKSNPKNYIGITYDNGYEWFVELFDENIGGSRLVIDIDETKKIFVFDVEINI